MSELTPVQQNVLDCIITFISSNSYPPTRAEIADIMGYKSTNAAHAHVLALQKKNAITVVKGVSRGIRVH